MQILVEVYPITNTQEKDDSNKPSFYFVGWSDAEIITWVDGIDMEWQ